MHSKSDVTLAVDAQQGSHRRMEVFLTGGTGSIGSAVLKRLLDENARIVGLARSDASAEKLRALGANAYPGDLRSPESWVSRAAACDAVVHSGATFSADMGRVDRQSMLALKKAAQHRQQPLKVIYTGGVWLFPQTTSRNVITEKTPFSPLPAFRYMTETIRTLSHGTDMNLAVVHPALVCSRNFGPIAEMTDALKKGQPFKTRATRDTLWPLVEVNDLADFYARVLQQSRFRMSLIASCIAGISVGHLASHISARHGAPLEIDTTQAPEETDPETDWSAGYALSQKVDVSHARRTTGWQPEHSTIEDLVVTLSK
ncbi:SDR family oxidoreductase [Roseibium porphyridii]|uniref:SDR family oxidoreductase n=1 Tax=Roseibium porphyridii TaxID=2866279 RepID=A0ABY8EX46_9HYPH|nr:SDR family oxidoreductase [Roseibium sp. KMA01]WFE87291.1 SDR family oxidoreductase [Roseibium sp. KMA01]